MPLTILKQTDAQHHRLFRKVDALQDSMLQGRPAEALEQMLEELFQETKSCFAEEENLMSESHYKRLSAHRAEHDQLLRQIEQFREDIRDGRMELSFRIAVFLRHWLEDHAAAPGREYEKHLRNHETWTVARSY